MNMAAITETGGGPDGAVLPAGVEEGSRWLLTTGPLLPYRRIILLPFAKPNSQSRNSSGRGRLPNLRLVVSVPTFDTPLSSRHNASVQAP